MTDRLTSEQILASQDADQAPPVTPATQHIAEIINDVERSQQEQELLLEKEREAIAQGVETEFWQLLKRSLKKRIETLRSASGLRLGSGPLDLQAIGLRSIIINEIADGFDDFIKSVENVHKVKLAQAKDQEEKEVADNDGE